MGGFYLYDGDEPLHPLHYDDVVYMVMKHILIPPTVEEIRDKSKGDAFSKGLALLQTGWFVMQCITRRVQRLPITELEIVTLAYAAVNVGMYWFWWDKPLNVEVPTRVHYNDPLVSTGMHINAVHGWYSVVFSAVLGSLPSDESDLTEMKRVPTFYAANDSYSDMDTKAFAMSMVAFFIFGAIHCTAWMFSFPTQTEQNLWHIFSVAILGVPVFTATTLWALRYARAYDHLYSSDASFLHALAQSVISLLVFLQPVVALLYIIARIVLLTLAFTSLRALPGGAYETLAWTDYIPHI